jgi:low affinity Fe/Cu permease
MTHEVLKKRMAPEKAIDHAKEMAAQGFSDKTIKKSLQEKGFSDKEIHSVVKKEEHKKHHEVIVGIIALVIIVIGVFFVLNTMKPSPEISSSTTLDAGMTTTSVSVVTTTTLVGDRYYLDKGANERNIDYCLNITDSDLRLACESTIDLELDKCKEVRDTAAQTLCLVTIGEFTMDPSVC